MADPKETQKQLKQEAYEDIPGTYVFDAKRSRAGYWLNMFCMSMMTEQGRKDFKENESAYLDRFAMTPEQKKAVLERNWDEMLRLGGNIYYTSKLAATDGLTFQNIAAMMTGSTQEDYAKMMLAGGRSPDGNRSKTDWTKKNG